MTSEFVKGTPIILSPSKEESTIDMDSSKPIETTVIPSAPVLPVASVAPYQYDWFEDLVVNKIPNVKVDSNYDNDLRAARYYLAEAEKYAKPFLQYQTVIRFYLNLQFPSGFTQLPLEQIEQISRIFKFIEHEGENVKMIRDFDYKTDPTEVSECIKNMYKTSGNSTVKVFLSGDGIVAEDHFFNPTSGLATFLRGKVPLGGSNRGTGGDIASFLSKMKSDQPIIFVGLMKIDTTGILDRITGYESTEGYVPIGLLPNGTFTDFKKIKKSRGNEHLDLSFFYT